MTVQPVDWYELCLNSAYDQDADELEPTDAARQDLTDGSHLSVASSSDSQRRPTNLPHGGSAHPLTFASPGHRPVFAGGLRPADASGGNPGGSNAAANRMRWSCLCGERAMRDCHGGRACMERINAVHEKSATQDVTLVALETEPTEDSMTQKDTAARNTQRAA